MLPHGYKNLDDDYAKATGTQILDAISKAPGIVIEEAQPEVDAFTAAQQKLIEAMATSKTPSAMELDRSLDSVLAAVFAAAERIIRSLRICCIPLEENEQQHLEAATLIAGLPEVPVRDIIKAPFIQEWSLVGSLLERYGKDAAAQAAAQRIGQEPSFMLMGRLYPLYGRALGLVDDGGAKTRLALALEEWNTTMRNLIETAIVFARKKGATELHELVEGSYLEQLANQAEVTARRKRSAKSQDPTEPPPDGAD